jgi:hypothetical protein
MKRLFAIVLLASCVAGGAVASAQVLPQIPDLQNRIPAPLPPPPEAPIINGPVTQSPSPGALTPPSPNTFGDRATQCLQEGSGGGLSGSRLAEVELVRVHRHFAARGTR